MIGLTRLSGIARFGRPSGRMAPRLLGVMVAVLVLLVGMGVAGLAVVGELNANTERIIGLHRKIAAYRQIQHDATSGLFNVAASLLTADEATLGSALRQLSQFGYDLDRLEFVARNESALLETIRADHRVFEGVVTEVVALVRAGRTAEARTLSEGKVQPLADRLQRLSDEMVNQAEAGMIDAIAESERAYDLSRYLVIAFVLTGAALAIFLGHAISWSMVGPVIDRLLNAILPAPAVLELTTTDEVRPRRYEDVVVLFADVVDFTRYCDEHPPEEAVANLQLLVGSFEQLAARHGLEKIKMAGDAVLATGNLLIAHPDPVMACVELARDLARAAADNPARWRIRVGIHMGPVVAGIVGRSKFSFDLWGDTVNVAARLAEVGDPAIHLSGDAWAEIAGRCAGESLGSIEVKGKPALPAWRCSLEADHAV
jgi:class 3 adenylate cyclase/CHASE3 domain sensor protein